MKSEKFLNLVKVITLAVILSAGIQYVAAQTAPSWAPPLSQPPANNTYSPLNVGGTAQSKAGGLIIGTNNNLATGLLVLNGNVGFGVGTPAQKLDVSGNVKGTGFCLPGANPTGGCITTWPASVASAITCAGTCTQNIISKFLSPTTIGNGSISDTGNGVTPGRVGINTSGSSETFDVAGTNVSSVLGNFRLAAGINADTNNYIQSFSSRVQGSWKNIIFTPYYSGNRLFTLFSSDGTAANARLGIGVTDASGPQANLDVQGTVRIRGGVPGANKVLAGDANGYASWQGALFSTASAYDHMVMVGTHTASIPAYSVIYTPADNTSLGNCGEEVGILQTFAMATCNQEGYTSAVPSRIYWCGNRNWDSTTGASGYNNNTNNGYAGAAVFYKCSR